MNLSSQAVSQDDLATPRPRNRAKIPVNEIQRVVDATAEQVRKDFEDFLASYQDNESQQMIYIEQIKYLSKTGLCSIYVDWSHLEDFNDILAVAVATQYYRMEPFLRKAVQNLVREHDPQYLNVASTPEAEREENLREFSVAWYGLDAPQRLRQIRMEHHGKLVALSGTVTRTSQVRPELLFGTFECNECHTIIRDVQQEFHYTQPTVCTQDACGNRTDFLLLPAYSKFADWQKVRIQENANEVPSGAMPRSMDIVLRGESVERAKAGDRVIITGTPIVVPDVGQLIGNKISMQRDASNRRGQEGFGQDGISGLKALGVRELTYRMVFLASYVQQSEEKNALSALHDLSDQDPQVAWFEKLTQDEKDQIVAMREDRRIYQKLASSVAPHIYGHEDVKKGILLQLLGGVHKSTHEGINLRGDINVCIVGDPSTAKSQFLKYVAGFMPRAIYTSGKASSAAGLTAS
ncbi:MCM DNA helicase complex subunit mcm6, partial [Kappamyces sp. JEL0680]